MKKEQRLMLELSKPVGYSTIKINKILGKRPDLAYVLGQLLYNRMGGVAYSVLQEMGIEKINREFRNTLKTVYESNCRKTESYRHALRYLSSILSEEQGNFCFLKGAYLTYLYPAGCRTSNDVDLLVNSADVSRIERILLNNGFTQGSVSGGKIIRADRKEIIESKMSRGETVPFVKEIGFSEMRFLEVDINFSLDFKSGDKNAVFAFIQNSVNWRSDDGTTMRIPSPVDFILHLCAHLYKEATTYPWVAMGRDLTLYKFCDLYLLLRKMQRGELEKLKTAIREFGLEKECYYAVFNTKLLYGIRNKALDAFLEQLRPEDCNFMKEILKPDENKIYTYSLYFTNWFFSPDRLAKLKKPGS